MEDLLSQWKSDLRIVDLRFGGLAICDGHCTGVYQAFRCIKFVHIGGITLEPGN